MSVVRVLDRYVFRIYLHGFVAALSIIAGLLIIHRFYKIMELAVSRSLDIAQILELVAWVLPLILFHSLPISAIIASLLTFGRLAGDSELIAMLSAGVTRVRAAAFPLAFSFLLALFAIFNNAVLVQRAYLQFDNVGFGVGLDPVRAMQPGVVERLGGRHICLTSIDRDRQVFHGLLALVPASDAGGVTSAANSDDRWLVTASSGRWIFAPPWVTLDLDTGAIRSLSAGLAGPVLGFGRYTLHLPLPVDRSTHPKRLTLEELWTKPSRANDLEVARRFLGALAIPPLALCAIMMAFPVGGGGRTGSGRGAVGYAFLLYLLYWLLSFGAESLVDKYQLHPLTLAAPLVVLTLIAVSLWRAHP